MTQDIGDTGVPTPGGHLLHVFPSFGIGGVPLRMVRVINHFGPKLRHTVIALDNDFAAAASLVDEADVALVPPAGRRRGVVRAVFEDILALRRVRPGLLITYNWGSIEWAMANRLFPVSAQLHFEAGFGKEEADTQIRRRVLFRRWALGRCIKVVVPSHRLERLALEVWKLPPDQVAYLPNGVDLDRFAPSGGAAPATFARRPGELVVGTIAPLRPEKNIGRLLRAVAALDSVHRPRLIVGGEGTERPALERLTRDLGLSDRTVFTGQVAPESILGEFDIFALSSDTEQMPNALLEAMAAGRAVAAVDVGDVKSMVCEENRDFVVSRDDGPAFAGAIARLLADPLRRSALGARNRARVAAEFSQQRMFSGYAKVLAASVGCAQ